MLVDNGDLLQGNPMGDYIAYERGMKDGDLHPMIKGMNPLGYECSTLGNHEFNYGLAFLDKVLAGANFPFVCANLGGPAGRRSARGRAFPEALRHRRKDDQGRRRRGAPDPHRAHRLRAAQIMIWDARNLAGKAMTRDIVKAGQAWVPQMKEEGAEIVIALSHSGMGPINRGEHGERLVPAGRRRRHRRRLHRPPASRFPRTEDSRARGLDAEGHVERQAGVMGGFWGSHMGLVDLLLERDGGKWRVGSATTEARPIFKRVEGKKSKRPSTTSRAVDRSRR